MYYSREPVSCMLVSSGTLLTTGAAEQTAIRYESLFPGPVPIAAPWHVNFSPSPAKQLSKAPRSTNTRKYIPLSPFISLSLFFKLRRKFRCSTLLNCSVQKSKNSFLFPRNDEFQTKDGKRKTRPSVCSEGLSLATIPTSPSISIT